MPTRHFARFDPSMTPILTEAFDRAWRTVEASGVAAGLDGKTAEMREAIAQRIVAMADTGITSATDLAMDALSYVTEQRFPDTRRAALTPRYAAATFSTAFSRFGAPWVAGILSA